MPPPSPLPFDRADEIPLKSRAVVVEGALAVVKGRVVVTTDTTSALVRR